MPASRLTQAQVSERRAAVLKARAAGMNWDQIARTVPGVADARSAAQDHRRAIGASRDLRVLAGDEGAGALELELQRLEAASLAVEGVLRSAAADPDAHDRVLRAADRLARLSELRSSLLKLTGQPAAAGGGEDELGARRRRVASRRQGLG